jgi:hypothetical protein
MTITAELVLKHNPERVWRQYLKGVVVEPGVALNETAAAIFLKIDGQRTLRQICEDLIQEFDVDWDTFFGDASEVVQDLLDQGIVLRGAVASA